MASKQSSSLTKGTSIGRRYIIQESLSQGGFGFTYKAVDTKMEDDLNHPKNYVVVKELFVQDLNLRNSATQRVELVNAALYQDQFSKLKRLFIREAKRMNRLHNSHIVRVSDYVEDENGTAYYIMDFVKGQTLSHYIRQMDRCPNSAH